MISLILPDPSLFFCVTNLFFSWKLPLMEADPDFIETLKTNKDNENQGLHHVSVFGITVISVKSWFDRCALL